MDDMALFRWILLGIGLAILVIIYALGRGRERREDTRPNVMEQDPEDATAPDPFDHEVSQLGRQMRADRDVADRRLDAQAPAGAVDRPGPGSGAERGPLSQDEASQGEPPGEAEKIVAMFLVAPEDRPFEGPELVDAFEEAGLEYGDMNIFHYCVSDSDGRHPVFSVANAVEPGWFDAERMDGFDTPGLALFLQLPGPIDDVAAVDALFECAERLQQRLGGELRDASRSVLSRQTMGHIRDDVQEYSRRRRTKR